MASKAVISLVSFDPRRYLREVAGRAFLSLILVTSLIVSSAPAASRTGLRTRCRSALTALTALCLNFSTGCSSQQKTNGEGIPAAQRQAARTDPNEVMPRFNSPDNFPLKNLVIESYAELLIRVNAIPNDRIQSGEFVEVLTAVDSPTDWSGMLIGFSSGNDANAPFLSLKNELLKVLFTRLLTATPAQKSDVRALLQRKNALGSFARFIRDEYLAEVGESERLIESGDVTQALRLLAPVRLLTSITAPPSGEKSFHAFVRRKTSQFMMLAALPGARPSIESVLPVVSSDNAFLGVPWRAVAVRKGEASVNPSFVQIQLTVPVVSGSAIMKVGGFNFLPFASRDSIGLLRFNEEWKEATIVHYPTVPQNGKGLRSVFEPVESDGKVYFRIGTDEIVMDAFTGEVLAIERNTNRQSAFSDPIFLDSNFLVALEQWSDGIQRFAHGTAESWAWIATTMISDNWENRFVDFILTNDPQDNWVLSGRSQVCLLGLARLNPEKGRAVFEKLQDNPNSVISNKATEALRFLRY